MSAPTRPSDLDAPGVREHDPDRILSSVDLPAPFAPTRPDGLARLDLERDVAQRPSATGWERSCRGLVVDAARLEVVASSGRPRSTRNRFQIVLRR